MSHQHRVVRLRLDDQMNNLHPLWARIFEDVGAERLRQYEKWGIQRLPHVSRLHTRLPGELSVVTKAVRADYYRELCDAEADLDRVSWEDVHSEEFFEAMAETEDMDARWVELIQTMATITAELEQIYEEKIFGTTYAVPQRFAGGTDLTSEVLGSTLNS